MQDNKPKSRATGRTTLADVARLSEVSTMTVSRALRGERAVDPVLVERVRAAAAQMAISILRDEKRVYPCCVRLNGQYKLKDIFVGAPVKLGKKGVNEIIKLRLKKDELELLHSSAAAVKEVADVLDTMNLF